MKCLVFFLMFFLAGNVFAQKKESDSEETLFEGIEKRQKKTSKKILPENKSTELAETKVERFQRRKCGFG